MSLFNELYHKDVNQHTEKVQGLTYLSWAWAWSEVKKVDQYAKAVIHEFPMMSDSFQPIEGVTVPYLKTPEGYFVKVSVTINEHTETEMLPVMDNKNVPLGTMAPQWVKKDGAAKATREYAPTPMPTTFDINKAHKRCLVKAIALHGLGLYIYAGEDVPEKDPQEAQKQENQRSMAIQYIKTMAEETVELGSLLIELESKMGMKLENFPLKAVERAYELLNHKAKELNKEEVK